MPTDPTDPFAVTDLTPDEQEAELTARWDALMPALPELGAALRRRYAEPHRRYHDRAHLLQVCARSTSSPGTRTSTSSGWRRGSTTPSTTCPSGS
jgi:hypothetical protein